METVTTGRVGLHRLACPARDGDVGDGFICSTRRRIDMVVTHRLHAVVVAAALIASTAGTDDTTPDDTTPDDTTPEHPTSATIEMWPATELGLAMVSCFDPTIEVDYVPDEDTLVVVGAYQEDDFVAGAMSGLVLTCVLANLDVPARVVSHIDQTRALDGLQEDSWGDYNAQWTYHPDSGLTITIWRDELPTPDMMTLPAPTTTTATSTVPPSTIATSTTQPVPFTGDVYTVIPGDTLFGIARKLNVDLADLLEANGLTEDSLLVPGQQLIVPQRDSTSTPATVATGSVVPRETAASCQASDSEEADGTPIVFAPHNVFDQDPSTVWRCEASVADQSLRFVFDDPVDLTSVGLIGGYVKVDPLTGVDRFPQNHRVRQVLWTFDDGTTITQELADSREMQSIPVEVTANIVHMEILATYPPMSELPRDMVPVAEVQLLGGSVSDEAFTGPWDDGAAIPATYTCDGADDTPLLTWAAPPDGTAELALSVTDLDAAGFVHWLVVGLPAQAGVRGGGEPTVVGTEAINSFGDPGWGGPCPPPGDGPHTYVFTLHLLDQPLDQPADTPTDELLAALDAASVDRRTFIGTYERT
jgi:phosphatidylethanolamine-binding protein (PEBP) family uncharacterized protein/LysM repeat protein